MVSAQCLTDTRLCQVVLAPNGAYSWLPSVIVFISLTLILAIIGGFFAWYGFWLILPFAGLELLVLGVSLVLVSRSGARRQVISIDQQQVRIEKGNCTHRLIDRAGPQDCFAYPRIWARLEFVRPEHDWYPSRLMIGASGSRTEIGEFLTEEEREELAKMLRQWL